MAFTPKTAAYSGRIHTVTLGTGADAITIGGQNVLPFYTFDASIAHAPKIGVEVSDLAHTWTVPGLQQFYAGCTTMAQRAQRAAGLPGCSFVAEAGGRLAGAILSGHDGRRGYLYHAAVLPEFRGQGIGRALVDRAMEALQREGIHKVGLYAYTENRVGNDFWEHLGFRVREDLSYRNKFIRDHVK